MVDMTDLKSVEHKSLVWVRLPPLVRVMIRKNDGTDAKHEMETFETRIKEWMRYKPYRHY